ncbi:unnamed protein product [Tenebrio molitor]|nr:unnamed protein product [Tenebrio molitor]
MLDNKTKQWSEGLRLIQSKKNRALHEGIKKSPYEAMFGSKQRIGLAYSSLERETYEILDSEEDLERILDGMVSGTDQEREENVEMEENMERVQEPCGVEIEGQVVCSLCSRRDAILEQRENAKVGLMKQAEKMLALSREKLPPAEIGQNVVVKVPDVDRRRLAPRSVVAVVLSVNESSLYKLGTKERKTL